MIVPLRFMELYTSWDEISISKYTDWKNISKRKLSEEFMKKYKDNLNWHDIIIHKDISQQFIYKFHDKIIWYNIYQLIPEGLMELMVNFQDSNDWRYASERQKLSENFIEKFAKTWTSTGIVFQSLPFESSMPSSSAHLPS